MLKLLANWPFFYLAGLITILSTGLIVGLTIARAMSIIKKIVINLLKWFIKKELMMGCIRYYIGEASS